MNAFAQKKSLVSMVVGTAVTLGCYSSLLTHPAVAPLVFILLGLVVALAVACTRHAGAHLFGVGMGHVAGLALYVLKTRGNDGADGGVIFGLMYLLIFAAGSFVFAAVTAAVGFAIRHLANLLGCAARRLT